MAKRDDAGTEGHPMATRVEPARDRRRSTRRPVAFASLQELSADLDALEKAHAYGRLVRLGNHEAGPIFSHLAKGMARSFDGFPFSVSWFLRLVGRFMKRRILANAFQPGFNLPAKIERSVWSDDVTFEHGLRQLREQVARAASPGASPSQPHPIFGSMSVDEWQIYYLRHAELHLSFLDILPS